MHHQEMPICDVVPSFSIPRPLQDWPSDRFIPREQLKGTDRLMKRDGGLHTYMEMWKQCRFSNWDHPAPRVGCAVLCRCNLFSDGTSTSKGKGGKPLASGLQEQVVCVYTHKQKLFLISCVMVKATHLQLTFISVVHNALLISGQLS
jgi:hypothetical protein